MSNILNHNRPVISLDFVKDNYWDFSLALREPSVNTFAKPVHDCLAVFIDTNIQKCRDDLTEQLVSDTAWEDADSENSTPLTNIGLTGLDNGLLFFDPESMSNREFMKIYTESIYNFPTSNKLHLTKVKSIYDFDMSANIVVNEDGEIGKFNGGFYQGCFYAPDHNYKVLPTELGVGWKMEFVLKPYDFGNIANTLNTIHPENKGMFFYIGTRAENKWYYLYKTELPDPTQKENYADGYVDFGYFRTDDGLNAPYIKGVEERSVDIDDNYVENNYLKPEPIRTESYVEDGYIERDIDIDPSYVPATDDGFAAGQPNIKEIETDNKFITYNRTKDGRRVDDRKEENRYILTERLTKDEENYFTLFNRSNKNRFDTSNIEEYRKEHSQFYDVYADLYDNALGFQITDDGRIGYRYIVKDCENGGYKIENEYSTVNKVGINEWSKITISIRPMGNNEMKISIYVNKRLVLVSRNLPIIKLKKLNDIYTRQESVPFNISLGGGTTGLSTAVYPDFRTRPSTVLPLESAFGGSFIGYIKEFKFYTCITD